MLARFQDRGVMNSKIYSCWIDSRNLRNDSKVSGFYGTKDLIIREGHFLLTVSANSISTKPRTARGSLAQKRQLPRPNKDNFDIKKPHHVRSLANPTVWRHGISHLRKNDRIIAELINRAGPIKFEPDTDHYEALVGSIIYQQLAGSAARAILNRFKQLYGGRIPSPKEYLATSTAKLRKSGLSPQKISYLHDLCKRLENQSLDLRKLSTLSNEEVVRELDNVRGIGRWTAEMFLIFMLGRTDVLPVDDLGVRKATQRLYRLRKLPTKEKFEQLAKNWGPYSSIATLYLWKSVEKPAAPAKW